MLTELNFVRNEINENLSELIFELENRRALTDDEWRDLVSPLESDEEYPREVLDHWSVSNWGMEKLRKEGERVVKLFGLNIWCRTTVGQPIDQDSPVRALVRKFNQQETP